MWQSRFTHVLQRFLATNFSLNVGLFDDLRTYLPESTWSDTSLDARTKFDYSVEEHSCYILRIYFSGSERSTRLVNNQTYDTKKEVNFEHRNASRQWKLFYNKMPKPKFVYWYSTGWLTCFRTFAVYYLYHKSRDTTREKVRKHGGKSCARREIYEESCCCRRWIGKDLSECSWSVLMASGDLAEIVLCWIWFWCSL